MLESQCDHLTSNIRVVEGHPGPPDRGVTGEIEPAGDQQTKSSYLVALIPTPWVVAFETIGLATAKVVAEPLPTEVCPVCDVPDVHDTSLLRQPSLLLGRRRLSEKDLLSVLVDAHRFFG
jgi:hypothetical protein